METLLLDVYAHYYPVANPIDPDFNNNDNQNSKN